MTILRSLFEQRTIDASDFNKALFVEEPTHAGVTVNDEQAMRLIAVYRCVRLISETIATLPVDVFRREDEDRIATPDPAWLSDFTNPEVSWISFVERTMSSLNLTGDAYIYTTGFDDLMLPRELWLLDPRKVEIKRNDSGDIYYLYDNQDKLTPYRRDGLRRGDVLHVPAFSMPGKLNGLSPIEVARQGIGLGLVTEKFGARFFGNGQNPSGVITVPGKLSNDQMAALRDNWVTLHSGSGKSHLPGVLTSGADWKPITISPEHAQFLETRRFQVTEIARLFGVPPHKIADVEKSTSWGTGIEEQNREWLATGLGPQILRVEWALTQFVPRGRFVKFNVNGLLRADTKTRFAVYQTAKQNGIMTTNEIRHLEDMNSIEGGDKILDPLNMAPADDEPDDAEKQKENEPR